MSEWTEIFLNYKWKCRSLKVNWKTFPPDASNENMPTGHMWKSRHLFTWVLAFVPSSWEAEGKEPYWRLQRGQDDIGGHREEGKNSGSEVDGISFCKSPLNPWLRSLLWKLGDQLKYPYTMITWKRFQLRIFCVFQFLGFFVFVWLCFF